MSKSEELYWQHLEEEQSFWCFKIFSTSRVFLFKTDNPGSPDALQAAASSSNPAALVCGEELRNAFVLTIRNHLQQMMCAPPTTLPPLHIPSATAALANNASTQAAPASAGVSSGSFDSPHRSSSPIPPSASFPSASSSSLLSSPAAASSASASAIPSIPPLPTSWSHLYALRHEAVVELRPIFYEQFMIQSQRNKSLQNALTKASGGYQEDELPITSIRKEKSGVLCMEQNAPDKKDGTTPAAPAASSASSSSSSCFFPASSSLNAASSSSSTSGMDDSQKWRDYYFVLFEGCLFYYKDSKSTTPTGFITLRYASLVVNPRRLSRGEYVFHVSTPLRTMSVKTKHAVALSEWISALDHTLQTYVRQYMRYCSQANSLSGAASSSALSQHHHASSACQASASIFIRDGGLASPHVHKSSSSGLAGATGSPSTPIGRFNRSSLGSMDGHTFTRNSPSHTSGASGSSSLSAPGSDRKSSMAVLQNLNRWINNEISSIDTFQTLIRHPQGLEYFRRALREEDAAIVGASPMMTTAKGGGTASAHLDFYLATQEYINLFTSPTPPTPADVALLAQQIFHRFLDPSSNLNEFLSETSEDQRGMIEDQLASPSPHTFDAVRQVSISILNGEFVTFKRMPEYAQLNELLSKTMVEDTREIDEIDASSQQVFLIKVKGNKRSREVPLLKKGNVHTIGRDKSNHLVIDDSRVSRSHARVEYNDHQCEYIDLGSSCGSKLNGKPVLRARLRPGDVIELGQSTIIFQVRKKKKMVEKMAELFRS